MIKYNPGRSDLDSVFLVTSVQIDNWGPIVINRGFYISVCIGLMNNEKLFLTELNVDYF